MDWIAILKSNLGDKLNISSYDEIISRITSELEVQHPVLTRGTQLLTLNCERNESLRDFISRVESMAGVCHVDKGLTSEEVTLLAILRGTPSDLRIKILQHFIEKTATVKALKVFADNLQASEVKLSGGVKMVVKPGKGRQGQPG